MAIIHNETEELHSLLKLDATEGDELSSVNLLHQWAFKKNKRQAPRYVRDDIVIALCEITPFSFGKEIFIEFVQLNDITTRGLSFYSQQFFNIPKKIVLNLKFHTDRSFKIAATTIYRLNHTTYQYQYGVKFDNGDQDLGDHLLETQRTLILK